MSAVVVTLIPLLLSYSFTLMAAHVNYCRSSHLPMSSSSWNIPIWNYPTTKWYPRQYLCTILTRVLELINASGCATLASLSPLSNTHPFINTAFLSKWQPNIHSFSIFWRQVVWGCQLHYCILNLVKFFLAEGVFFHVKIILKGICMLSVVFRCLI